MMSPSTSVSEVTQEQQTIEEAFIAVYVAARTDGTFPTPADGLQCIADAEREVAGMEATAARTAASKGTKRVQWIEGDESDDEPRASKIRSRKSTGDTTEDLSLESMDAPREANKRKAEGLGNDAKDGTSGLEVAARESTHEGAQEVMAELLSLHVHFKVTVLIFEWLPAEIKLLYSINPLVYPFPITHMLWQ